MPVPDAPREWIKFRHARFTARFPSDFRYSPSHYWMSQVPEEPGLWRVGFTKFATRMLGELVDFTFSIPEGGSVEPGRMIGWVEGFKAASDVFCVMNGRFAGSNPALRADACIVRSDPYLNGWLYAVRGEPEPDHLDAAGYIALLDTIITKMASEEHAPE
ncbi:MAG: gcvH [Verrucomicrobiales bacterium]|nr:gcvH [Verrucomicrobiales bacterium]